MRLLASTSAAVIFLASILGLAAIGLAKRDYDRADYAFPFRVYQVLATLGVRSYQTRLGIMYLTGRGVAQDRAAAATWFREPAESGDAWAQHLLGLVYLSSTEGFNDQGTAFSWFLKAAEAGYRPAQEMVAASYALGSGVTEDKVQALKWLIIVLDGKLPASFPDRVQKPFTDGITPKMIARAKGLARAWLAKRGKSLSKVRYQDAA